MVTIVTNDAVVARRWDHERIDGHILEREGVIGALRAKAFVVRAICRDINGAKQAIRPPAQHRHRMPKSRTEGGWHVLAGPRARGDKASRLIQVAGRCDHHPVWQQGDLIELSTPFKGIKGNRIRRGHKGRLNLRVPQGPCQSDPLLSVLDRIDRGRHVKRQDKGKATGRIGGARCHGKKRGQKG